MENLNQHIEQHYLKENLYEDIISRLEEQGIDLSQVKRSDIAGADEFHVRGAVVSKELAGTIDLKGKQILDVGCGLGGPCRMLADEYACEATGIDLSHEYIRTAQELSRLVKLEEKTSFIQGDASHLPFEDESFDVVWTQHVQMNVPDKKRYYSEINRVLKPGGSFLFYDILTTADRAIEYPMPWASEENCSFLSTPEEMHSLLTALGLRLQQSVDQTKPGVEFFEALVAKLKAFGPPKMGLNVLMGASTKPKLLNLLAQLKEDKLQLLSGVYQK